jgi:hypothetical protein
MLGGATEADVQTGFLSSPEYRVTHATDAAFVAGLYRDVLARAADSGGQAYWLAQLQGGATPEQVIAGFLTSPEAMGRFVDGAYLTYLRRVSDAGGRQYFLDQLFAGGPGSEESVALQILGSPEYFTHPVGA